MLILSRDVIDKEENKSVNKMKIITFKSDKLHTFLVINVCLLKSNTVHNLHYM